MDQKRKNRSKKISPESTLNLANIQSQNKESVQNLERTLEPTNNPTIEPSQSPDSLIAEGDEIIREFAEYISNIKLDACFADCVNRFIVTACNKRNIITTGMGKAGMAMRKFSATLCSLGIPSFYLHPGEASHGDSGIIRHGDILFVASTSGKTREVLETIEIARQINGVFVVGITSHADSPIRTKADLVIDMGLIQEAGYLRIAPTTSIIVMSAITDAIALVCAKNMNLKYSDYLVYHHSGYLGDFARNKSETR